MVRFGCHSYCSSVGNVDAHGISLDYCALNGWDCWGEYQQWHELHQWDWSWVLRISKGPRLCSLSPCRFPAAEQSQMLVVAKEVYVPTVDDIPSVWNSIGHRELGNFWFDIWFSLGQIIEMQFLKLHIKYMFVFVGKISYHERCACVRSQMWHLWTMTWMPCRLLVPLPRVYCSGEDEDLVSGAGISSTSPEN